MAWEGSDRRSRLPANWAKLVNAVMVRADGRCEKLLRSGVRCPRRATDVDHIIPNDDHRLTNLQALCPYHHGVKSAREGNAAQRKGSKKRPPERHPGARGVR